MTTKILIGVARRGFIPPCPPPGFILGASSTEQDTAKHGPVMRTFAVRRVLLIEPSVLEAPAVINAVDHDCHALDIGLHAGGAARVKHDGPRPVLLQLLVDLPDQLPALFLVGHYRLLDEFLVEFGIAISVVMARGAAGVVFEELLIGVVNGAAG